MTKLDDIITTLKALPLFQRVEVEALRLIAFSANRRQLRAGDMLFRRGELSDGGFLVLAGEIVLDCSDDGAPSPHLFGPGALIGQNALFSAVERAATALARDNAMVLVLSRDLVQRVLEAHPASAQALRDYLAAEARSLASRLGALAI
ncbi:MAG: Crp/Fnr family transcriptional regulator [Proteobacteria bacterium]|nr:Crp/Fnr family transcriptional regulator [Pseudomonadota bacterium]